MKKTLIIFGVFAVVMTMVSCATAVPMSSSETTMKKIDKVEKIKIDLTNIINKDFNPLKLWIRFLGLTKICAAIWQSLLFWYFIPLFFILGVLTSLREGIAETLVEALGWGVKFIVIYFLVVLLNFKTGFGMLLNPDYYLDQIPQPN